VPVTGSTNADLLAAVESGDAGDRTVLVADHQVAGRGRLDRRWDAPAGTNLLVSLLLFDVPDPPVALTQRVGIAALDAARAVVPGVDVMLKWPNDLLLEGRKVAGILAQRSAKTGAVVVGLGFNIGWAPDGAARLGDGIGVARVLRETLVAFDALGVEVAERYRHDLATLDADVHVDLPDGTVLDGRATGVDDDGRLIVAAHDGTIHHLDVGDVVHARHAR
jgi:BirA family transcriptional regulator, biotin operon repressor / biotin---[acetyl-CoA-carboxylase] ligase